jgi:hypothetical protein
MLAQPLEVVVLDLLLVLPQAVLFLVLAQQQVQPLDLSLVQQVPYM